MHHSCLSVPDGPVGHRRVAKDRDTEVDPRCLLTHPRVLLLRLERLLPGLVPLYTGLAQVSIREVRSRQVHVAQVRAPPVRVAQVLAAIGPTKVRKENLLCYREGEI